VAARSKTQDTANSFKRLSFTRAQVGATQEAEDTGREASPACVVRPCIPTHNTPRQSHAYRRDARQVAKQGIDQDPEPHWLRKAGRDRIIVDHLGKEGLVITPMRAGGRRSSLNNGLVNHLNRPKTLRGCRAHDVESSSDNLHQNPQKIRPRSLPRFPARQTGSKSSDIQGRLAFIRQANSNGGAPLAVNCEC
jgi:hypothetical protein